MAKGKKGKERTPAAEPKRQASDSRLYLVIALLAAFLAFVVWWSIPSTTSPPPVAEPPAEAPSEDAAPVVKGKLDLAARGAAAELVVLTDKTEEALSKIATREAVADLLDVRHCGAGCGALKTFVLDEKSFEVEVVPTEDYILPPKDTLDTVAPGLSPEERAKVHEKPNALIVRTQGPFATDHLPARVAFATTLALAEALDGFIYDEIARRIETRRDFADVLVRAPLGQGPVFRPRQIVVQLYRQPDGTARLLTLGMIRFGLPDFSATGSSMAAGPQIANVLNAAASLAVAGNTALPLTITIEDVAKAMGKTPADLGVDPAKSKPIRLNAIDPGRHEGDPDNDMAELVPEGGATREGWDAALADLFGEAPKVVRADLEKPLAEVAERARQSLPDAITRFRKGEGQLFLKSTFVIPEDARLDGGPSTESLWVQAASCDDLACVGTISNHPEFALNLALGKTTTVKRAEILDWLIKRRDGTQLGGASIKLLENR